MTVGEAGSLVLFLWGISMLEPNSLALHYEFYCFYFSRGRRVGVRMWERKKKSRMEGGAERPLPQLLCCSHQKRRLWRWTLTQHAPLHTKTGEVWPITSKLHAHLFFYTLLQHCSLVHIYTHISACSTLSSISHTHTQASRWPAEFVVMATHPSCSLLFLRCVLLQDFSLSLSPAPSLLFFLSLFLLLCFTLYLVNEKLRRVRWLQD